MEEPEQEKTFSALHFSLGFLAGVLICAAITVIFNVSALETRTQNTAIFKEIMLRLDELEERSGPAPDCRLESE